LRAVKAVPEFASCAEVHLVETSPLLRNLQKEKLGEATWHDTIETLPAMPCFIVANEFFDALPIQQFENRAGRWFQRCIGCGDGTLKVGLVPAPQMAGEEGLHETSPVSKAIAQDLGLHIARYGGMALVIDYGHLKSAIGDTLQAMRKHEFVSILENPGEADITAHVDFESLAKNFISGGVDLLPMLTQGQFLKAMGLDLRTEKLAAKLDGQAKDDFVAASRRLADAAQMGNLFKVMAVAQKIRQPIYPFEAA
jgi:NADH dehydrogenase [ubiquinone] 1 alpha subcomplex assembly factor 7